MGFEDALRHPKPGGKIDAARHFGIDLSMLIENLRLTPDQRLRRLQESMNSIESLRAISRKSSDDYSRKGPLPAPPRER